MVESHLTEVYSDEENLEEKAIVPYVGEEEEKSDSAEPPQKVHNEE